MPDIACEILLTESPLETPPQNHARDSGAMVEFWGVVRRLEDGREIDGIDYEAYREMATHQLQRIAQEAAEKFWLDLVIVHHRIGFVAAGQASLLLRVASPHRSEAFQASQWIVDELKKKVPIWKKPRFRQSEALEKDSTPSSATSGLPLRDTERIEVRVEGDRKMSCQSHR